MRIGTRGLWFVAAIATAVSVGCANDETRKAEAVTPESRGFRWVGPGDPTNFGADFNFCNRTVTQANLSRLDPYLDPLRAGRVQQIRNDYTIKRDFWSCMEGRGWELASAPPRPTQR